MVEKLSQFSGQRLENWLNLVLGAFVVLFNDRYENTSHVVMRYPFRLRCE